MFCVYEGDHLTLLNVYNAFIRVSKSLYCFCFKAVVPAVHCLQVVHVEETT